MIQLLIQKMTPKRCVDNLNTIFKLFLRNYDSSLQTRVSLSQTRNTASFSIFYPYFYGLCSHKLHSFVPPPPAFVTGILLDWLLGLLLRHY